MTNFAIGTLLATIALGALVGARFLMRARWRRAVHLHLAASLLGLALVATSVMTAPGKLAAAWPIALLAVAIAAGWAARRVARGSRAAGNLLLVSHVFVGLASFFVLLAWAKTG